MPKNWGLHGIFHHGMHLSAVVSYDDERVFDKEGNEIQVSIIKTYSKERNSQMCDYDAEDDDDDVFYKLCKQSWCEENYIVVYHDV